MPANPDDVVAFINIALTSGGAMGISGSIGDKKLAVTMLEHALEAVKAQLRPEDGEGIVIPNRDVVVPHHPAYPTRPLGDLP